MAEEANVAIEIFIKSTCPYSRALRRKLEHDGTPFVEHDVERDTQALQRMLELNGGRRNVPTLVIGGQVTVGFHGT